MGIIGILSAVGIGSYNHIEGLVYLRGVKITRSAVEKAFSLCMIQNNRDHTKCDGIKNYNPSGISQVSSGQGPGFDAHIKKELGLKFDSSKYYVWSQTGPKGICFTVRRKAGQNLAGQRACVGFDRNTGNIKKRLETTNLSGKWDAIRSWCKEGLCCPHGYAWTPTGRDKGFSIHDPCLPTPEANRCPTGQSWDTAESKCK